MTGLKAARKIVFVTHAQVVIDPDVPIEDWPLSDLGRERHKRFSKDPLLAEVSAIYSSAERKARDGAAIHAANLGMAPQIVTELHENDRSATGFLPPDEFEAMADRFFALPDDSQDGWETATDAQTRIVSAVRGIVKADQTDGDILIVAHGAVGALLRGACLNRPISRDLDQPAGGGNYFVIELPEWSASQDWRSIG